MPPQEIAGDMAIDPAAVGHEVIEDPHPGNDGDLG
jgi:hypothetical protein